MPAAPGTTLLEIVNTVAGSVGHPTQTTVSGSSDEAIKRMIFYANLAGTELAYMCNWQILMQEGSISIQDLPATTSSELSFDLPTDFKCFTDDTQWNASTQLPALGPISPQDWQWFQVQDALITTRFMWRLRGGKLWVKSPPPYGSAQPFTFEYLSKYWARDLNVDSNPNSTPQQVPAMTLDTSYHVYDSQLMILYTRQKWMENEGFDSSGAMADFQKSFQWLSGTDKAATALSLVPGGQFPYLNVDRNAPDTGYGSVY